ncbi:unnamed protein product [Didymodactylos carnosus]|nr:unnamed protein product [Didymodactylos carnosus]CAF4214222.1 unnamed protein product [Didymodactylos carnosus]
MPTRDSSPPSPHSNHHQTNKRPPTTMTKPRRPHRSITTSSSSSSSRHTSPEDGRRSRQSGTINKAKITEQQQRRSKPSNHRKHSSSSSSLERPPPEETDPKPLSEVRITAKPPMYRLNKDPSDNDDENDTSSESGTKVGGGDITDISPMQTPHYRNKSQNNSKTFELNSMMNVLLGSQNESGEYKTKDYLKTRGHIYNTILLISQHTSEESIIT